MLKRSQGCALAVVVGTVLVPAALGLLVAFNDANGVPVGPDPIECYAPDNQFPQADKEARGCRNWRNH